MIWLCNISAYILLFFGFPVFLIIILLSEKRRKTFLHRLMLTSNRKPSDANPIWIHALSLGEVLSAVPLVQALSADFGKKHIVFSASTYTGFNMAEKLFQNHADMIFYFPYDIPFCVRRAIHRINPAMVIIVETDIWPNFLFTLKTSGIPVSLVNARLSERSYAGYHRFSFFTKQIFANFSKICTQTQEDAQRFVALGVSSDKVSVTGNIKFDQPEISLSDQDIVYLYKLINPDNARKTIVAGSTHEGEEAILAESVFQLKQNVEHILLIIAPRDPKRAKVVSDILQTFGLSAQLLSEIGQTGISGITDVVVIDRIGILRKLYALADIAFVGGSLAAFGGHNPIEPAAFAKPVLFGPDMSSFKEISAMFLERGGAISVHDSHSFYTTAYELLTHQEKALAIGHRAYEIFSGNKGAVEKTRLSILGR